jgi:hypothetical protein
MSFPGSTGCKARPSAGFCFSGLFGLPEVDDSRQLAGIALAVQYACSSGAEILVIRAPKSLTVTGRAANQPV